MGNLLSKKIRKRKIVKKEVIVKESVKSWIIRNIKEEFSGVVGKVKLVIFLFIYILFVIFLVYAYSGWIELGAPIR